MQTKLFAIVSLVAITSYSTMSGASELACDGKFEGETVKIIVSYSAGGGYDTYARIFAPHYEKTTGARTLVENWPAGKGRVGSEKIRTATPDGLTIGVMDASRRIVDHLLSDGEQPDILENFTLLARFARSQHVLLTSSASGINSINDLFSMDPPSVFGTSSYHSTGFLATVLLADLLQINFDTVTGLGSTRKRVLAVSRNDVDLISSNYFSVYSDIESNTVRPLLQTSSSQIADHIMLENVPLLGGPDGIAAHRAADLGLDVAQAVKRALAIDTLISAGRVFVAPTGLPSQLAACLQQAVLTTLQSEEFIHDIHKLNMSLDVADGPSTLLELKTSQPEFEQLIPILKNNIIEQ